MRSAYLGKVTYTRILAKNILLVFLAIIICITIGAFFVRDSISDKLENISRTVPGVEADQYRPEQALLLIHQAEDDFQQSLYSTDSMRRISAIQKLTEAFRLIDTLLKNHQEISSLGAGQHRNLRAWYDKKVNLSGQLFALKHDFDSLIAVYAGFDSARTVNTGTPFGIHSNARVKNSISKADTVKKFIPVKKKGLLARVKDAIVNKGPATVPAVVEIRNQTRHIVDSVTFRLSERNRYLDARKFRLLQQRNTQLFDMQNRLIALNIRITNELERIINEVKEINYNISAEFKGMAFKSYRDTTTLLNKFYLAAIILVLIFAVLLIAFIVRLDRAELLLRKENERAVIMAQQKMDLLLHMSHEIRNPLTAIKGFLYIFSKTDLSVRQTEMLGSIRLSSDMLLRTLNDTLDAAKMESGEFKMNSEPFSPDFTLKEVIESMSFSAAKKELDLGYEFEGDKNVLLLGDSFRLKQVMINLLSNAIKYTGKGSVTVRAKLEQLQGDTRLQVDVTDTGMGITKEQQVNLFSKYYRTNAVKEQIGTGLGLFICKQLIELQKGQISVKSIPGAGSTFSFYIPYRLHIRTSDPGNKLSPGDPVSLLNGLSILAVDDNEFSLMFLRMMTDKWNIRFFQASDGKEALDIISKENITIVFTDIQMPVMDGNQLMAAIRKLKTPLNRLPVIVISGDSAPENKEKFIKSGFSGFLTKPFIEADLIRLIVQVLDL